MRHLLKPLSTVALLLLGAPACGVDEHPHEADAEQMNVGGRAAPPPPPVGGGPVVSGGTGPTSAGAAGSAGSPPSGSGGNFGRAGAPSAGAFSTGGTSAGGASAGAPAGGSAAAGAPAVAGASGIMVDINGTMLPKESVIAFVHLGHSNMAGRASSPSASRAYHFSETNLRAWVYRAGSWTPALEPNTAGDRDAKRFMQGGPGTALVKEAVALAPTRYFVSLGYGVASAYCSQFLPGGLYYDQFMAAPKELKGKVTFGAIVIMLGITERHGTDEDISGYPQCVNKIVTAIRTDLGEPALPLVITDYEMGSTGTELSPTGAFAEKIIPQIQMIPTVVTNAALVPTDDVPMQDNHHFNLDGQKLWAQHALQVLKTKGWFPW